jgi:hypothetical protein
MKFLHLIFLMILLSAVTACASQSEAPQVSDDGLSRVESKDFDLLYLRPETDFSAYESLYLETVSVEFDKDWLRQQNLSNPTRIRARDKERISKELNDSFTESFAAKLAKDNNYTIVEQPEPGTLIVQPAIIKLKINHPNTLEPYRITVLAEEAGSMTINLDLIDAENDQTVLRLSDYRRARSYGNTMRVQSSVQNRQESNNMFRRWAQSLNTVLDTSS